MNRVILSIIIVLSQITAQAQPIYDLGYSGVQKPQPTAEYIHSASGQKNLVAIELLGAVDKPGVYYVPERTDLLKLLTLAGGVSGGADTEGVLVRKTRPQAWSGLTGGSVDLKGASYRVDMDSLLVSNEAQQLALENGDFVYVPRNEPLISDDVFRSASVLSLVVGSILTAVLIADRARQEDR